MATLPKKSTSKPKREAAKTDPGATAKHVRKPRRVDDEPSSVSPAASGPAGARLEGHVGAQYLLPLLSGGEARGLPGVVITRVKFQRGGFEHPLDDVIVTGHDHRGMAATLEVQAKRTIAFTAADSVFADVVALSARAAAKPEFDTTRYELAIAIARTSTRIEQHIQEVLKWAREYQDANGFFRRVNHPGAAHQAMRDFVNAFRGHMLSAGAAHDDAMVWRLLRRFQILAFDFEQPGSICALVARDRCALQLAPQEASRANELWDSLQQIALEADASGGDVDALELRRRLATKRSFRLAGDQRLYVARERLAEISGHALAAISTDVRGVRLERTKRVAEAQSALERGRYLEIRGGGGVGKSGVLKDLAQRISVESRVVVVAPHRVPGGGWAAFQAQLGCDATALQLLTDLAGDGGGTLFVDGIDRFDDPREQATVSDLIRTAAEVPGFRVIATARPDFDADARAWLPTDALRDLGEAPPLLIDELGDEEVVQLAEADPALAALLRPGHPAEKLVRNLYRLDRLARSTPADGVGPHSEVQMAQQWWASGDSVQDGGRRDRRRLLKTLALHSLGSSAPMDTSNSPDNAIRALIESGSLQELELDRVEPAHDVLRDWAVGCLLYEEPEHLSTLAFDEPAPVRLVRGVELAARMRAELHNDATAWTTLLDRISVPGAHGSWRRTALLALARSERSSEVLNRCLPILAADGAALLNELIRAAITVDSHPVAAVWEALGIDVSKFSDDFVAPSGTAWLNLIVWSLQLADRLPLGAVPQFVNLYGRWCNAFAGQDFLSPVLVGRLYEWLVAVEAKNHPRASDFRAWIATKDAPGLSMTTAQENDLRMAFLMWCRLQPDKAEAYLRGLVTHPNRQAVFRELLPFIGTAAQAAPAATADLFLEALPERDTDDERSGGRDLFSGWDLDYFPASPARKPFLELLQADAGHGLRLVRGIVAHAVKRRSRGRNPGDDRIEVPFPGRPRSFPWRRSYMWARGQDSHVLASALMALEAWAHQRIERGDQIQAVIDDVLGDEAAPAAFLLVAIDIMLSHWPRSRESLWPYLASAGLLAIDRQRFGFDITNLDVAGTAWVHPEPAGAATLDSLRQRPSRRMPLDAVLDDYGRHGPAELRVAIQETLRKEAAQIGSPDSNSHGMADPRFAVIHALNRLDPANYVQVGVDKNGRPLIEYASPAEEAKLLHEWQTRAAKGEADVALRLQLAQALTEQRCPPALLEQAVTWATSSANVTLTGLDATEVERTRFSVAALLLRDGSSELKATYGRWASDQLLAAADRKPDSTGPVMQIPYNPAAIAAIGLLAAYSNGDSYTDLSALLSLAARHDTSMASVLRTKINGQRSPRPELARALIRLGFVSAIYAVAQRANDDYRGSVEDYLERQREQDVARAQAELAKRQAATQAELGWLTGAGAEPNWPELPDPRSPRESPGLVLSQSKRPPRRTAQYALDAGGAAEWLLLATDLWGVAQPKLLGALVRHCWAWTANANGVGGASDEEPSERVFEWNNAYFRAALVAAVAVASEDIDILLFNPIAQLPEERFFDALGSVLHKLDILWLDSGRVNAETVLAIRETFAQRLQITQGWQRLASRRSSGIEMHLARGLAAMFMGQHVFGSGPQCYVLPSGIERAEVLLPLLTPLAERVAGSTFAAAAFLSLLEVQPLTRQLPFMARVVAAWWQAQGASADFWIDHGFGRRLCVWIDKAVSESAKTPDVLASADLVAMVDTLVQCGIPSAKALDERLSTLRQRASGA